jgi:hypothetical protein
MLSSAAFRSCLAVCPAGADSPLSKVLAPVSWLASFAAMGPTQYAALCLPADYGVLWPAAGGYVQPVKARDILTTSACV